MTAIRTPDQVYFDRNKRPLAANLKTRDDQRVPFLAMAKNGQKALSAGADAFFAKPVDPDELLHFIGAN